MEKQDAKKTLLEAGRYNITVERAKEICKAFGVELDNSIIRTTRGYRENVEDPTEPRVNVATLSKSICLALGKEPHKETLKTANRMNGEGSYRDYMAKAYATNL